MDAARMSSLLPTGREKLGYVECGLPIQSISIGPWWWLGTIVRASSLSHGSESGTGLHDRWAAINRRSEKASGKTHVVEIVESATLKIELIPGFHENSNSSVMEVILLRTLKRHIRWASNWLTFSRGNDKDIVSARSRRRYHHVYGVRGVRLPLYVGRQPGVEPQSCGSSWSLYFYLLSNVSLYYFIIFIYLVPHWLCGKHQYVVSLFIGFSWYKM